MAAELQVACGATYTGTGGSDSINAKTVAIDSTDVYVIRTQTLSTDVAVAFPSATGRVGAIIANTGATNAILVSLDGGGAGTWPLTIVANSVAFIPLASGTGTINIKAAASTTTFDYMSA